MPGTQTSWVYPGPRRAAWRCCPTTAATSQPARIREIRRAGAFEVTTGCPEPRRYGSTRVDTVQLGAARCNERQVPTDVVANPQGHVVTGFEDTQCLSEMSDAVVSERGLEPPRDNVPLGPQPRTSVNSASYSRGLEAASRRHATHPAIGLRCLNASRVPAKVPAGVPRGRQLR